MIDDDDNLTLIGLDDDRAVEALERLARNVPPDVAIGRPLAAAYNVAEMAVLFLTDAAFVWSHPAHAERLVPVGDSDLCEWTSWFGGIETARVMHRSSDGG